MDWVIEPQLMGDDDGDDGIILICPGLVRCRPENGLCFTNTVPGA